jgi:hypothetical protein
MEARFKERAYMLGSLPAPGRAATRDDAAERVAFRHGNTVGARDIALSRLNGQPAHAPADASPCSSQNTTHGPGAA